MAKKDEEKKSQNSSAIQAQIKKRDAAQKQLDERDARLKAKKEEKWGLDPEDKRFDERGLPVPPGQNNKPKPPAPKSTAKNFNVGVSKGGVSFKDAFKHFKDKGSKTFTWNGKKYTTQTADEKKSGSSSKADAPAKKTFRQRRAANLKAKIADENVGEGRKRRLKRRLGRVERRMAQGKADGGEMVKGYYQGGSARLDESLGERRGKESTKSQSMKSRRNESRGATKKSRPQSAGVAKRGWGAAIR